MGNVWAVILFGHILDHFLLLSFSCDRRSALYVPGEGKRREMYQENVCPKKRCHHVLSSFYLGPPLWANGRINLQIEPQRLSAISWLMWASMKERRKDDEAHDDSTLLGPLKKKKRRRAQQQDQETELPDQMHNHQIISVHLIEVLVIWSWCCHPFLCRSQERFRLSETQERKKSPDQIKEKLK